MDTRIERGKKLAKEKLGRLWYIASDMTHELDELETELQTALNEDTLFTPFSAKRSISEATEEEIAREISTTYERFVQIYALPKWWATVPRESAEKLIFVTEMLPGLFCFNTPKLEVLPGEKFSIQDIIEGWSEAHAQELPLLPPYIWGIGSVRFEREMSIEYVAKECGISPQELKEYETVKGAAEQMTVATLKKLSEVLGVSKERFFAKSYFVHEPFSS